MIQKPKKYDDVTPYMEQQRLPAGGYIIKIMNSKVESTDWGNRLVLQFDIEEGEEAGYYKANYDNQQQEDRKWKGVIRLNIPTDEDEEWKIRLFKSNMTAVEESNNGYAWNWDESSLKGKLCGALFRNKEYEFDGRQGFYTECFKFMPAEQIRYGEFDMPADKLLPKKQDEPMQGFTPVDDSDIPF